ncbi:3-oxoacyl-[acyl-carrier-protein] synthase II [Parasporobacterium paucivorans DSM 15970]|uniref:3-oxoacyl-[acyl-carrier-protein] synthase 2 n=1 Tax=Parasporobacterium paucivorans DSM 15970 TaxID=1122934 RepID=A0A1M6KC57_9FIRM|nr:beta-ketoacyl-ACP synthase II [Parasporobacterium paucivorans]SHJ56521.1 3-oxoacyl-[acyl-carrier-protein] synthase II [Parasporobacterium paucivorans DSM 15970]
MNRVVITGMGVISPVGNEVDSFWESLVNGKVGIGPITRFDTTGYKATLAAEVKGFDPSVYMERSDILHSDLYTQFGIAAAAQAVEDSGILGTVNPERMAVYFGTGIGGMQTFIDETRKLIEKGPRRISPFFIPMTIANMAAGMIAIRFGCKGAAMPSVTACASGTNAIGEALRAIRHGYADAIIAGGAEATITELAVGGFGNMMALSTSTDPMAASLPFDKRRGGFVMGEGAGALILENYEHAKARGAKIYAEICGYGSTCDAYHITAPNPEAEGGARAISDALQEAGITEEDRVYINAHGTGTPLNDAAETIAIKKSFGEERARQVLISSTKGVTGHMLGAAGAVEAIAAILALNKGIVPPTAGLTEPDPACDLDYVPVTARESSLDLVLSTSLGFGGHNACVAFRKAE